MSEDRTAIDPLVLALELARKQILEPELWIKKVAALSITAIFPKGLPCSPTSPYATCYCAEGANALALHKLNLTGECDGLRDSEVDDAVCNAFNTVHGTQYRKLYEANDAPETTHAMIIAAYDHAIKELG